MIRNQLSYLLLLLAAGLFAILYNVYFTGIIFIAAVILPLILIVLLFLTVPKVTVRLETDTPIVEKGDILNIIVKLKNDSIFPVSKLKVSLSYCNLLTGKIYHEKFFVSLDRNSKQRINYQITSLYCGNLIFRINKIRIYDYFTLWSYRKKMNLSLKITMLPTINELPYDIIYDNKIAFINGDHYSESKSGDDPSEVYGIREYRAGDRPHRIHWKLTYRQDKLMIKELSEPTDESIIILFDWSVSDKMKDRQDTIDGLLECVMSVSYSCIKEQHMHQLTWFDEELDNLRNLMIKEQQDIFSAMDLLLQSQVPMIYRSIITEHNAVNYKEEYTHMIYITSFLTEENILDWTTNRNNVEFTVIYVNNLQLVPIEDELRSLIENLQINYYEIDVKQVQQSIVSMGA